MDDIVRAVAERTGLNEEQSRQAVDAIADVLKERLPGPASAILDRVLTGQGEGAAAGDEAGSEGEGETAGQPSGMLDQATQAVKGIFARRPGS